jgi:predicted nucleic acid-binding protein
LIIVDTNVIAYFIVPGDITQLAEAVRDKDPSWAAPWLWRSEMRNLLSLYVKREILSLAEIQEHMASAEDLLLGREYQVASDEVLTLAANSGCTAYDCEFVYLAEILSVPLITTDKKLLSAFPQFTQSMEAFTAG